MALVGRADKFKRLSITSDPVSRALLRSKICAIQEGRHNASLEIRKLHSVLCNVACEVRDNAHQEIRATCRSKYYWFPQTVSSAVGFFDRCKKDILRAIISRRTDNNVLVVTQSLTAANSELSVVARDTTVIRYV